MKRFVASLAILSLALFSFDSMAHAEMIGAGAALAANDVDSAGTRMNIDDSDNGSPNLAAGTYNVTNFMYGASTNTDDIQPFLARLTGDNAYEVLWVGPTFAAAGSDSIATESYDLGTQQFTLAADTDVYAGFNAAGPNVKFGAGRTDHANPADFAITVGAPVSGFGHANLGRSYAFEVNVEAVPEPASLLLGTMAFVGLGWVAFRRRRSV